MINKKQYAITRQSSPKTVEIFKIRFIKTQEPYIQRSRTMSFFLFTLREVPPLFFRIIKRMILFERRIKMFNLIIFLNFFKGYLN